MHEAAARSWHGAGKRTARSAVAASGLTCALLTSVLAPPVVWQTGEPWWFSDPIGPLALIVETLARGLPIGELGQRAHMLTSLFTMGVAIASVWMAFQMFRGPGRWLAAVTVGPLVLISTLHWANGNSPATSLVALPFTLLATLAIGIVLRSLVRSAAVTRVAATRALAAAAAATVVAPLAGLAVVALVAGVCIVRLPPRTTSIGRMRFHAHLPDRETIRSVAMTSALACLPFFAVAGLLWSSTELASLGDVARLGLSVPKLSRLGANLDVLLVLPALTLVLLLVVPLRWRGGPTMLVLLAGAAFIHIDDQPLVPTPMLLVALAICGAGWIWLAGSILPRRARLALVPTVPTAVAVVLAGIAPRWDEMHDDDGPLAATRAEHSILRVYARGLATPGDVLLAADPWLHEQLSMAQREEGFRPDMIVRNVGQLGGLELGELAATWARENRRVLSDSFTLAGRWPARWASDNGPLFCFVGAATTDVHEFTDLSHFAPSDLTELPREQALRWERLSLERARFRRAIDQADEAVAALDLIPADERRNASIRIQLARTGTLEARTSTELGNDPEPWQATPGARTRAELGDLLLAAGVEDVGIELLGQAAQSGFSPAWGVLARWELRAGEESKAHETMTTMAGDPELRPQAVGLLYWLVHRGRVTEAVTLRDALAPDGAGASAQEVGARLALLTQLARHDEAAHHAP